MALARLDATLVDCGIDPAGSWPVPAPDSAGGSRDAPPKPDDPRTVPGGMVLLALVTPMRLLGDALALALQAGSRISVIGITQHVIGLRELVRASDAHIALIDINGECDLDEVRLLAAERPDIKLAALGVIEKQAEVIRYAKTGFSSYIPRNVPLRELEDILIAAALGRAYCSAEIAAGLMHALFRTDSVPDMPERQLAFTRREGEILHLLGRRFSNKDIARDLALSPSTVKNHVHNVLTKLGAATRNDASRAVRERPWIASQGL